MEHSWAASPVLQGTPGLCLMSWYPEWQACRERECLSAVLGQAWSLLGWKDWLLALSLLGLLDNGAHGRDDGGLGAAGTGGDGHNGGQRGAGGEEGRLCNGGHRDG